MHFRAIGSPGHGNIEVVTQRIAVPLSGPSADRARNIARELVISAVLGGGEGWEAALEPMLTEMANDRVVGALTTLRLVSLAAAAVAEIAETELAAESDAQPGDSAIRDRVNILIDELLALEST